MAVRRARLAGMGYAEIEALFRAACAWERYREAAGDPGWLRPPKLRPPKH